MYVNFEHSTNVAVYSYDIKTGIQEQVGETPLLLDPKAAEGIDRVESSDILMNVNAGKLYACVRGVNVVSVAEVDESGGLKVIQNVKCQGDPRGLSLSPDGHFLFTCNIEGKNNFHICSC